MTSTTLPATSAGVERLPMGDVYRTITDHIVEWNLPAPYSIRQNGPGSDMLCLSFDTITDLHTGWLGVFGIEAAAVHVTEYPEHQKRIVTAYRHGHEWHGWTVQLWAEEPLPAPRELPRYPDGDVIDAEIVVVTGTVAEVEAALTAIPASERGRWPMLDTVSTFDDECISDLCPAPRTPGRLMCAPHVALADAHLNPLNAAIDPADPMATCRKCETGDGCHTWTTGCEAVRAVAELPRDPGETHGCLGPKCPHGERDGHVKLPLDAYQGHGDEECDGGPLPTGVAGYEATYDKLGDGSIVVRFTDEAVA